MTDNRPPGVPTRRQLLAGLGTLGAASAFGGGAGAALLSDSEAMGGTITAGDVSLTVDCPDCLATPDGIAFDLAVDPGESGSTTLSVAPDGNPVRLWVRTTCPPVGDAFARALEVTLGLDADCDGEAESTLFEGSLADLRRSLVDGRRLEGSSPCVPTGQSLCLDLGWELPADVTIPASSTTLAFEFYAEQCRHQPESAVTDPFAGTEPCPEEPDCPACVDLGKIDVQGDQLTVGESYAFTDAPNEQYRDDGHEYAIEVLSVTDEGQPPETVGAGFRLLRDGDPADDLRICAVAVGGGRPDPDLKPSDPDARVARYTFDPPSSSTPGQVYAAHGAYKDDPLSQPDDDRPAISNITVSVCADGTGEETDD
ncbi:MULTISPECIES: hypothetical protein [Halolamina]|uniref:SipW-cognate class signal peptide n=1 Tax=Halolamina pelagica TaxID=699431 RepID=A0A1I5Q9T7_9EURY|nr:MULTISPECIES: hypothetical protein [Halolamina]NHX35166.1 hypothetical protein [Halolamina sp. R1-12]SFP42992.1 hypothetical protein SAMN05216277_103325 [Halolamina pelagica]